MNILVAPDSFKGSLTSVELCKVIRKSIEKVSDANVIEMPISDGGEGFLESICKMGNLKVENVLVTDPLGRRVKAEMAIDMVEKTAFIEMAKCSGLTLLTEEERNPLHAFSYGIGDFINQGLKKGCRKFIIGLGGSATNDAGVGMLMQLGAIFTNKQGQPIKIRSLMDIKDIAMVNCEKMDNRLFDCEFILATDVNNPLCGEQGATYVFGPQKGLKKKQLQEIDDLLHHYGNVLEKQFSKKLINVSGLGAAGGILASFVALFNTTVRRGIDVIFDYIQIERLCSSIDLAITGEGKLDQQTFSGKVIYGICKLLQEYNIPVVAICGNIELSRREIKELGLAAAFSICKGPSSLENVMTNTRLLVSEVTENIMELIKY